MPPGEAEWNATVLAGDVAEAVAKLTEQPGQNIIKYGTGEFSAALREHKLVDEYHFWVFPEVAAAATGCSKACGRGEVAPRGHDEVRSGDRGDEARAEVDGGTISSSLRPSPIRSWRRIDPGGRPG
jgi:hypothetical protein